LDLLEYEDKFKPAVAHVFGYTFVADDKETAKLVAMESNMERFNCVTLQGDSYRADGILTGGANQIQPVLAKISQYLKIV
jgi:chromosome segregation ATPase